MKLTKELVNKMVKSAENNGFSKESVFEKIKLNKSLDARANKIADAFWSK